MSMSTNYRSTNRRTASTPKPTIADKFMERVQLDVIDLRTRPDGEYRYIVHARDHFTRFSWAEALTDNKAIDVARFLFKIFTQFGPPEFLQSNNKKEFVAAILHEFKQLWPGVHIINGDARDPRSQGLMTRGNSILKNKLSIWLVDNKRQDWHVGLPLVVRTMNTLVCSATKHSPYYLVFGQHPQHNLALLNMLSDSKFINEEDLPDGILADASESEYQ
ncbi:6426_t:CDS:1 [Paraglomus occultum]|uniref:6426_t:CDS:1 n=1 Tax=Paraglomus occultum TaxID=144539 RepID=A0A9N9GAK9_9GLOM|nr:6426_t:CDS:1 [Paraglomus occultum]